MMKSAPSFAAATHNGSICALYGNNEKHSHLLTQRKATRWAGGSMICGKALQARSVTFLALLSLMCPIPLPTHAFLNTCRLSSHHARSFAVNSISTSASLRENQDEKYMALALIEAQASFAAKEVPVGAVLVSSEGQVLATGRNRVEATGDASAHAELECLRAAALGAARLGQGKWRMLNCTLYVTLEPCLMCLGAVQSFRVQRVVYGARSTLLGAIESYVKVLEQAPHPFHSTLEVKGGVHAAQCGDLMKRFFAERRLESERMATKVREAQREEKRCDTVT